MNRILTASAWGLLAFFAAGVSAYATAAWISWVSNLLIVEWWMRRKKASTQPAFSATAI